MIKILLVTIIFLLQTACGPTYIHSILLTESKFDPQAYGIVIGAIELEETPSQQEVNSDFNPEEIYKVYREALSKTLKRYSLEHKPGKNKITTNITILGYKEGNAFIRWLSPAGGESRIQAQATLEIDGQIIGGVENQMTIAWGGLYSIGGWRMVVKRSAINIGTRMCQEAFQVNLKKNCQPLD